MSTHGSLTLLNKLAFSSPFHRTQPHVRANKTESDSLSQFPLLSFPALFVYSLSRSLSSCHDFRSQEWDETVSLSILLWVCQAGFSISISFSLVLLILFPFLYRFAPVFFHHTFSSCLEDKYVGWNIFVSTLPCDVPFPHFFSPFFSSNFGLTHDAKKSLLTFPTCLAFLPAALDNNGWNYEILFSIFFYWKMLLENYGTRPFYSRTGSNWPAGYFIRMSLAAIGSVSLLKNWHKLKKFIWNCEFWKSLHFSKKKTLNFPIFFIFTVNNRKCTQEECY